MSMTATNAAALQSELSRFTGTERYHRWSALFPDLLTDGAHHLAQRAGMFWLMDIVGSVRRKVFPHGFATLNMTLDGKGGCLVSLDDGNGKVFYKQAVPYTDAPFNVKLFVSPCDENRLCIMLPSEY